MPYTIDFVIRRVGQNNDTDKTALVLRFHPWRHIYDCAQLVLLHVTDNGLEKVEVPRLNEYMPEKTSELLSKQGRLYEFEQLHVDEWTLERAPSTLTSNYQELLVPGEKYELFWPGAEIDMWGWGVRDDYTTKQLKCNSIRGQGERLPRLILPATKVSAFTARAEDEPWPDREKRLAVSGYWWANHDEWQWRLGQERIRNPPPSPPALEASERV
jgi:hypothetical protein